MGKVTAGELQFVAVTYANGQLQGEDTAAPYAWTIGHAAGGLYRLTAVALDSFGASTTSAMVEVTVSARPTVSLTAPLAGAVLVAGQPVELVASASDADGSVAQVAFFDGATQLVVVTTAPYTFNWSGAASGAHQLTAVATDNSGLTRTSTPVSIVIDAAPTVVISSPPHGANVAAGVATTISINAADVDGTVAKVVVPVPVFSFRTCS